MRSRTINTCQNMRHIYKIFGLHVFFLIPMYCILRLKQQIDIFDLRHNKNFKEIRTPNFHFDLPVNYKIFMLHVLILKNIFFYINHCCIDALFYQQQNNIITFAKSLTVRHFPLSSVASRLRLNLAASLNSSGKVASAISENDLKAFCTC